MRSVKIELYDENRTMVAIIDIPQSDGVVDIGGHSDPQDITFDRRVASAHIEEVYDGEDGTSMAT